MQKNKRSLFTENENKIILEMVQIYGEDWEAIARKLPNRTPKQCHDRYSNYLRDGLKKDPWSKQEDEKLLLLFNEIGPKWSKMMNQLPGRSGNDIKNRWHKHLVKEYNPNATKTQSSSKINQNNDYQMFPLPINQNFNSQVMMPQFIPMFQTNSQMIPLQHNNFNFEQNCFASEQFKQQKKVANFQKQKSEESSKKTRKSLKQQTANELNQSLKKLNATSVTKPKEAPVQLINKIEFDDDFPGQIFSASSNQQTDPLTSFNIPDLEIQEFFDSLNHANIDFFALL